MKKLLLMTLFFQTFVCYSAVISLTIHDSIVNPMKFANNYAKTIYGKSASFISGNKKFIIGVFDSNHNDTLDKRDVVSISELKSRNPSLYSCVDQINSNYALMLKFILLEKRTYKISDIALDRITIELTNSTDDIKQFNFINYLFTINQFSGLFRDSSDVELDSTQLNFSNGKPTVLYYTALHCQPCEKLEPLIKQALDSRTVNLIIVSSDIDKGNSLNTYKNIYYFSRKMDPSKVWNTGFPRIMVFDKNGKFIESENCTLRDELIKKYAFPH